MAFNAHRSINRFKMLARGRSDKKDDGAGGSAMDTGSGANSPANVPEDAAGAGAQAAAAAEDAGTAAQGEAAATGQPRLLPSLSVSNISDGDSEEEESITLMVPRAN